MKKNVLCMCAAVLLSGCQTLQTLSKDENVKKTALAILTAMAENQGRTYNYVGTMSSRLLQKNQAGEYIFVNETGDKASVQITLPVTMNTTAAGTIIPALTIDGASMTAATLANLANASSAAGGTITVGDNSTADASLTFKGKTYPISAVFLDGCTYTANGEMVGKTMQIYFGENAEFVADLSFSGKVNGQ